MMMKLVAAVLLSFFSISSCSEDLIRRNIDTGVIRTIYDRNYDALYVSSVDFIYKVDASNVSRILAQIEWKSTDDIIKACSSFQDEYKCRNHIKVLNQLNSTHIFICGTFSYNPTCCYLHVPTFTLLRETCGKSMWRAPYNPDAEVHAAVHGDTVVTATFGGFYGDDPFMSITGPRTQLRSKERRNFFNSGPIKPHFAGVIIKPTLSGLYHKAYVFFHELAEERNSYHSEGSPFHDEMRFSSRVGSVCLNDKGGSIWVLSKRISSFQKMSLICAARMGKYSVTYLDFTHIVQTQIIENPDDENDPLVVALFRRGKYEGGSAVCAYQFKDIQKQFETNRFWRPSNSDRSKLYEYDDVEEDECTQEKLSDERLRFKESHLVKAGFIRSKYSQPIFYDEEKIFTKFSIANDKVNQPLGHHLILANEDGLVRRIFLHSSDLINDGNVMPERTVLPDLQLNIPHGKSPLTLIKEDTYFVTTDRNGLTQRVFPTCAEYQHNCTRCHEDLFCVWSSSEGKCVKTENGSDDEKPECKEEEPAKVVEDVPVVPQTTINTKELVALQSRNKALKHDLGLCRSQLKHMKSWTNKELTKYRQKVKNQTSAINTCQDNLMSYSHNCIQAKSALLQKNKILQKKLRTMQRQSREDVYNAEEKATLACKRTKSRSDNMEAVCDCKTNTVSYGYGWFEDDTKNAKYFVGENKLTFDDAKKYCEKMNAELPEISHGGFMKTLITNFDSSWKFWMGFTTGDKSTLTKSKRCLQVSTLRFWSFVHCDKLALPVCRKSNTEAAEDATMNLIETVARGSQMYRLN